MSKYLISLIVSVLLIACAEKMPTQKDGSFSYRAVVLDTLGIFAVDSVTGLAPFRNRLITLESESYFSGIARSKIFQSVTDKDGVVHLDGLAYSDYLLYSEFVDTVRLSPESGELDSIKVGAINNVTIDPNRGNFTDTLYTYSISPNLVINEIYYAGPVNEAFYFYDQFVELYNASTEIKYLDGLLLCRASQLRHPQVETNDFVQAIYIFQFPGTPLTGTEYPVQPGEFVVVAGDALDHSQFIDTALDLSSAGWEFYNPLAGERDNPAQNVTNVLPDRTTDFMINLAHNGVFLADGSEWSYGESYSSGSKQYIHIPISTVIDAVEYSPNSESTKEITMRLDAGLAGVGLPKYSGMSVERRTPGFDTNNSRLDFINREHPTPGR